MSSLFGKKSPVTKRDNTMELDVGKDGILSF